MRINPSEDPAFYKISKFDVVLISFIVFSSVFCLGWANRGHLKQSSRPGIAFIYHESKLLEKVNLGGDKVIALLNGRMQVEVKKGMIKVLDSDCPQHICMNAGWVKYSGQTIVCVPNKVMIEVKSTDTPLIDAVAN